ncbi:MAG: HK97 family phage prohead protease [Pseudonocardiaceae bacterium]
MDDVEVSRARAAEARRQAFTEGADEPGIRRARRSLPIDVDNARVLTLPTKLTATREFLVKRSCDCGDDCLVCACEAEEESFWSRAKPGPAGADAPTGTEFVHLSGNASVADTPYEMWDFYGPYVERVARDAFSDSLARQPDVAFLANHEGMTMARTRAGTLLLSSTPEGLIAEAWLNPQRTDCSSLITAIKDGCIDQMSFGAMLEDGIWNDDFTEFTLTRLDLNCGDVSAVNFGANPYTSIASRARRVIESIDRMPESAARAAWKRLDKRFRVEQQLVIRDVAPKPEAKPGRSVALVHAALLAAED